MKTLLLGLFFLSAATQATTINRTSRDHIKNIDTPEINITETDLYSYKSLEVITNMKSEEIEHYQRYKVMAKRSELADVAQRLCGEGTTPKYGSYNLKMSDDDYLVRSLQVESRDEVLKEKRLLVPVFDASLQVRVVNYGISEDIVALTSLNCHKLDARRGAMAKINRE